jgi:hypothetical protein
VITGAEPAALSVIVSPKFPVPKALVAPKVTEKEPETEGVPLMTPVLVLTEIPEGRPVAL